MILIIHHTLFAIAVGMAFVGLPDLLAALNNGPDQLADRAGLGDFDSIHSRPDISGAAQDHV